MSKEFSELVKTANDIRAKYNILQQTENKRVWTAYDRTTGLVGDVGQLCKLIQTKFNLRNGPENIDESIAHELSDCLWSIITISEMLNINLEKSYFESMGNLQNRIEKENK